MTEYSPPYFVVKTPAGFVVMNSMGGHEALFSNRGEAEEIARLMNEDAPSRARVAAMQAQLANGPVSTQPFDPPDDELFYYLDDPSFLDEEKG